MSRRRQAFGVLFGLAVMAAGPAAHAAPSAICASLVHELERVDGTQAATSDTGLSRSIFEQRQQLDLATVDARRNGCIGGAFFRENPAPSCATLMPAIAQMEENLQRLNAERSLVKPKVILTLGATAALGVLGRKPAVTKERGRPIDLPDARALLTVHPSYLLRIPDRAAAAEERDRFVADLKKVRTLL